MIKPVRGLCVSIILLFSTMAFGQQKLQTLAEKNKDCLTSTKEFNQCIHEFNIKKLPDTEWCGLIQVSPGDVMTDRVLLKLELFSKDNLFEFTTFYIPASSDAFIRGKSSGVWNLDVSKIEMTFDSKTLALEKNYLPQALHIDFYDNNETEGENQSEFLSLSSYSMEEGKIIGPQPIPFMDCKKLFQQQ